VYKKYIIFFMGEKSASELWSVVQTC